METDAQVRVRVKSVVTTLSTTPEQKIVTMATLQTATVAVPHVNWMRPELNAMIAMLVPLPILVMAAGLATEAELFVETAPSTLIAVKPATMATQAMVIVVMPLVSSKLKEAYAMTQIFVPKSTRAMEVEFAPEKDPRAAMVRSTPFAAKHAMMPIPSLAMDVTLRVKLKQQTMKLRKTKLPKKTTQKKMTKKKQMKLQHHKHLFQISWTDFP